MTSNILRRVVCAAVWFLGIVADSRSQAALVLYEGFNYSPGSTVNGQTGGTGFVEAWLETGVPTVDLDTIQGGSLSFGALLTSGQSVKSQAPNTRITDYTRQISPISGTPGTTLWVSFLTRKDTANAPGSQDAFGLVLNSTSASGVFIGDPFINNSYMLGDVGGGASISTNVAVIAFQTVFLVVRIDFLDGADTIRMFVNPTPGGPAPTLAAATRNDSDLAVINGIRIFANEPTADPRRSYDEIRIGSSFADVAPIPEPGISTLLAAGLFSLAGRRRPRSF